MSTFKVYLNVYTANDVLAGYEEITQDVVSLGNINQQLDASDFDLGVFRNGGFAISLRNTDSKYATVTNFRSIFRIRRNGCPVKITWTNRNYDLICGFFQCGEEQLGEEVTIFEGLLNDVVSESKISDQIVSFQVLGFETLFAQTTVPFTSIANDDLVSEIIYTCLNQSTITSFLTVDIANILPNLDVPVDFVESLENATVDDALNNLLRLSNSVLYVKDGVVYVSARTPTTDLIYTFYGQASNRGIENIIDITKYRDGLNRTLNFLTWPDTSLFSRDLTSIDKYGVQKKEVQSDLIDPLETAKIQSILDSYKTEFAFPKTEMELETPMSYDALALFLLDKINIDYPNIFFPSDNNPLPRYGQARYGQAQYPFGQFTLTISDSDRFKILNKKINTAKQTITFGLRKI